MDSMRLASCRCNTINLANRVKELTFRLTGCLGRERRHFKLGGLEGIFGFHHFSL